jgi:SAM-dependent methyltransferase
MQDNAPTSDWWASFYDDNLAEMFLVRTDPAELEGTLAFLAARLDLAPGKTAFDQCCGIGGLSIPLAQRGVRLIGIDLCGPYIRRAREQAAALGLDCRFQAADAFAFVPEEPCDAAFNWYSSFGYAAEDERNRQMLRRAFAALKPGGRFALDFPNMAGVLSDFKECIVRRHPAANQEILLLRESRLNLAGGMLEQQWTYVLPGDRRVVRHSAVRFYLPHALGDLLAECGFTEIEFFGSIRGEPLALHSPRCIVLARRPRP